MQVLALKKVEAERRKEERRIETEELTLLAYVLRKELDERKIKDIFYDNLNFFEGIKDGTEKNWRHSLFYAPGNSDPKLRKYMVGPPFNDLQQDQVYALVEQIWMKDMKMYMDNNFYINMVLLPSIFIRIVFFGLDSFKEAERRIGNLKASLEHSSDTSGEFI